MSKNCQRNFFCLKSNKKSTGSLKSKLHRKLQTWLWRYQSKDQFPVWKLKSLQNATVPLALSRRRKKSTTRIVPFAIQECVIHWWNQRKQNAAMRSEIHLYQPKYWNFNISGMQQERMITENNARYTVPCIWSTPQEQHKKKRNLYTFFSETAPTQHTKAHLN